MIELIEKLFKIIADLFVFIYYLFLFLLAISITILGLLFAISFDLIFIVIYAISAMGKDRSESGEIFIGDMLLTFGKNLFEEAAEVYATLWE